MLDTLTALPGLDGFVRPRFNDGTFDDPLPLGEHYVERFLQPSADRCQLVIQGPRGCGLTTTLRWLAHLTREGGVRQVVTWDELCQVIRQDGVLVENPAFGRAFSSLASGEAVLFLDLSITPIQPEAWREIHYTLENGFRYRTETWQTDREILRHARMVVACPEFTQDPDEPPRPFGVVGRWAAELPYLERAQLCAWSDDDLLELLGSSERYREQRSRLFGELRGVRHGDSVLRRARTARWLIDAALEESRELTLSGLYANVLDRLAPESLDMLRELKADALDREAVKALIQSAPDDVEETATLFEVSRVLAALCHEIQGYEPKRRADVVARALDTTLIDEAPKLALPGLHEFFQAGMNLQAIARGEAPTVPPSTQFDFLREMITPFVRSRLRDLLASPEEVADAAAATLLWVTGEVPVLDGERRPLSLSEAWLAGISLPGAKLAHSSLWGANLTGARFEGADLSHSLMLEVTAPGAGFGGAQLTAVNLRGARLPRASFRGAWLERATLIGADLTGADLSGAYLEAAELSNARLERADLSRINGTRLRLWEARLGEVRLSGANLREAELKMVDLRSAWLDGVDLRGAQLDAVTAGGVELDGAEASESEWTGCDASEASFVSANLFGASFNGCRLHDARFDGADLQGAEFCRVDFHAGSSRSGVLLGKPALEGNMTGYYSEGTTDEKWASPESIRQASFRGADLRGARFLNTDLHRIDLRGAVMDQGLREQARKAGAILDDD